MQLKCAVTLDSRLGLTMSLSTREKDSSPQRLGRWLIEFIIAVAARKFACLVAVTH